MYIILYYYGILGGGGGGGGGGETGDSGWRGSVCNPVLRPVIARCAHSCISGQCANHRQLHACLY